MMFSVHSSAYTVIYFFILHTKVRLSLTGFTICLMCCVVAEELLSRQNKFQMELIRSSGLVWLELVDYTF